MTTYFNEDELKYVPEKSEPVGTESTDSHGLSRTADVNGDGLPDIITGTDIVLNDGNGDFSRWSACRTGRARKEVTSLDVDNDGDIDLIVVVDGEPGATILLNLGSGDFSEAEKIPGVGAERGDEGAVGGDDANRCEQRRVHGPRPRQTGTWSA